MIKKHCHFDICKGVKFDKVKYATIAKLKNKKSWERIFNNGNIVFLNQYGKNCKKCIKRFIICNSYGNEVYDADFGNEINIKKGKYHE